MMLEVDVESNNIILLTEPLTQLEVQEHDGNDAPPYLSRNNSSTRGYENSYVIKHFVAGTMALVVLAALVYFNRHSIAQCGSNHAFGNGPNFNGTVADNIVLCNSTSV